MAVDKDKLQRDLDALGEAAMRRGEELAVKATQLAEQGLEWATPRAQKLYEDGVALAAPKIEEAAIKVRPYLDNVHDKVVEDYLPRIEEAAREAQRALAEEGSLTERVSKATEVATETLTTAVPKKRRFRAGRVALWTLGGAAVAGAGYLAWRRSQPIDDPWAEEYWADLDTDADFEEFEVEEAEVPVEEMEALEAEEDEEK
ncbi:hypothetical protein [Gleimia coleocanis]|nr:hypothetical protein [Gleimia coleocanis]